MRKQIVLVLAFFLTTFAFAQEVKLTHNLPTSAKPGETIDAQFTVTKGNIGAFAKFQCDLPAGYQAQAGDTKSGNFTFENNRVKIVWVSLPGDATFSFSIKLTIPASASGSASIGAQFYYLENNVKKEFDLPAHTISLGGDNVASNTVSETKTTSEEVKTNPVETKTTPIETKTTPIETKTTPIETKTTPVETKTVANKTTENKTTNTAARSGVIYSVQVAALSNSPGRKFNKYGKTKVVQEGGMYKVLVGSYNSLEDARKQKAKLLGDGAVGCFIVAYENGVKVKP